jgi:hypothetical protein
LHLLIELPETELVAKATGLLELAGSSPAVVLGLGQ